MILDWCILISSNIIIFLDFGLAHWVIVVAEMFLSVSLDRALASRNHCVGFVSELS